MLPAIALPAIVLPAIVPLAIDLDGTLSVTDTLAEQLIQLVMERGRSPPCACCLSPQGPWRG